MTTKVCVCYYIPKYKSKGLIDMHSSIDDELIASLNESKNFATPSVLDKVYYSTTSFGRLITISFRSYLKRSEYHLYYRVVKEFDNGEILLEKLDIVTRKPYNYFR